MIKIESLRYWKAKRHNAGGIRNTYTKSDQPTMMGTSKKIGGTLSGEAAAAAGAAGGGERALDPKIAIFKVPPFLN